MSSASSRRRRRWPFLCGAVVLGLVDLFMVTVLITGVLDTEDPDGKVLGVIMVGIVVAILTWLTWLCVRAFVQRGRPEAPAKQSFEGLAVRAPVISRARKAGGMTLAVVFFSIAAIAIGIVITDLTQGDMSSIGGGVTGTAFCLGIGISGLTMARTPSSAESARFLGELARSDSAAAQPDGGSAYPTASYGSAYPTAPYSGQPYGGQPYGTPPPIAPSWTRASVDAGVTYRESMSELPWRLLLASVALTAVLIWGITISPPAWVIGVIAVLLVVPVFLLVAVIIFLPYGIRLAGGTLSIGAHGVPRVGRGWKRQEIPLAEVLAWTVCRRKDISTDVPRSPFPDGNVPRPAVGKGVGNWGNFTGPGVRHVLVVCVDPARVPAAMPTVVMMGYGVQDATATARDRGIYMIGTRHPQRVAHSLEKAIPSRRALT